jgi:hypothetical protein
MKHKLIKLPLLVLAMTVLSSSKESVCVNKPGDTLHSKDTCVQVKKADASVNKTSKQATVVVKEKNADNTKIPLADYKIPVIPFSRFIL